MRPIVQCILLVSIRWKQSTSGSDMLWQSGGKLTAKNAFSLGTLAAGLSRSKAGGWEQQWEFWQYSCRLQVLWVRLKRTWQSGSQFCLEGWRRQTGAGTARCTGHSLNAMQMSQSCVLPLTKWVLREESGNHPLICIHWEISGCHSPQHDRE